MLQFHANIDISDSSLRKYDFIKTVTFIVTRSKLLFLFIRNKIYNLNNKDLFLWNPTIFQEVLF